ncbi:short chain dehydrogenase [Carnobacterium divergens]|uniref:short chain dehydrogenase n=1 Tax=Carnobacterium divergens TaxID=2748 RepID=UPI001071BA9E|nr:short chain dehydrogenase [Carnobacterium divergens]TFI69055.1 short chain dehydrogenase [Carnobacterium divergens]TFI69180.1 short chain dehydrogenase [Carnobacterium divergens]TFI84016.1 short chain dehydrogenase [Carnobacterium divergens]TFJ10260.1 short chain dehydrogenase [Carnobacterium divergens]TFJ14978.1 short chain dehydrogenase [Carnobacterium divergens]
MKKALIIGGTGTIGTAVAKELEKNYEVLIASRHSKEYPVDISSVDSIQSLFEKTGKIDAVIVTAGAAHFGPLKEMTVEDNLVSVTNKLLGQVNIVLLGTDFVKDKGSFTLVTGIMMDDPIYQGASAALANWGVRAFAKSAALELPRGIRINTVSPNVLKESWDKYQDFFVGFNPVSAEKVANAFVKSVRGLQTGESYEVY